MKRKVLIVNDDKFQLNQLVHLMSNLVRKEKLEGKEHLVIPTILIVEGVHNNLYYPADEISKFAEAWDGRPVVIQHPTKGNKAVSANSPKVLETSTVGKLFNTRYDNKKLKSEVWIDISKASGIEGGKEVLNLLNKNKHVEVSTGLFLEDNGEEGEWNGEKFKGTASGFRPDHLALLPGGMGACSWKDGAGMPRLNESDDLDITILEGVEINKEMSHEDIRRELSNYIQKKVKVTLGQPYPAYPYICEVYDDNFIYEYSKDGKTAYFKQSYLTGDNKVALEGDPVEVSKVVSYEVVVTKNSSDGQKDNVSTNKAKGGKMTREERISALIANAASGWKVEDTEFLTGLSDDQFGKVEKLSQVQTPAPATNKTAAEKMKEEEEKLAAAKKAKEANNEDEPTTVQPNAQPKPVTIDEYIANAPAGMKDTLRRAYERDQIIKNDLVKELVGNSRNKFSQEKLESMDLETLENLANLAQVEVDYSGAKGGESLQANASKEVLETPKMDFSKK